MLCSILEVILTNTISEKIIYSNLIYSDYTDRMKFENI